MQTPATLPDASRVGEADNRDEEGKGDDQDDNIPPQENNIPAQERSVPARQPSRGRLPDWVYAPELLVRLVDLIVKLIS